MAEMILDWEKYIEKAAEAVAEGVVLLKNDNAALPLDIRKEIAVFGRIQFHYYKSGTGSGGMVNVTEVIGIPEGLEKRGAKINEELRGVYEEWEEKNPFERGAGWGTEPWSQKEMPLDEPLVKKIAGQCETALVIIGRTAGEDGDIGAEPGGYYLSETEETMLSLTRKHFRKVVVVMNVAAIMDMEWVEAYQPDAVLYGWQGGMTGGLGTADVLLGNVSPSGHLTDTIAKNIADYPSHANFGDREKNIYQEDIYLGYRYFETFAKEKIRYPFGFGLSYASFEMEDGSLTYDAEGNSGSPSVFGHKGGNIKVKVSVKNTGSVAGKEVVQLYCAQPQGKLGKPARILCGFEKTKTLQPGETEQIHITVDEELLSSYDDSGATGHRFSYLLEAGEYCFFAGSNIRETISVGSFALKEDKVLKQCESAMAPVTPFQRMKAEISRDDRTTGLDAGKENIADIIYEETPVSLIDEPARREKYLPEEIAVTDDRGIVLADVVKGEHTLEEFTAQLSDEDLCCIVLGEGMGSPKVTPGTASAFGGVTKRLFELGIPCACCADGPSGIRMDCGTKAFSLPNGTLLACTFNQKLQEELFSFLGMEMAYNKVDCLLGPGINLHRYPLNGRNFEYFSEDAVVTGKIAAAQLRGFHQANVTGTIKHFCANNQEKGRHTIDSVVSERALRELYLKGFELAVKEGGAWTIMTTYGAVNGLWTAGSYDLNTMILRKEWEYQGITMTDWWAAVNRRGGEASRKDYAGMVIAQNDVYMVCQDAAESSESLLKALKTGDIRRCELQRNAINILKAVMNTNAMRRLMGTADTIRVLNRPDEGEMSADEVKTIKASDHTFIDLTGIKTEKNGYYSFILEVDKQGFYEYTITASSKQGELAQIPVTLFCMGTACGTHTWSGTDGKPVALSGKCYLGSRHVAVRMYFAQDGLDLHSVEFNYDKPRIRVQD